MELGVGIVYWPGLEPLLLERDTPARVVEVEPQPFWFQPGGAGGEVHADPAVMRRIEALPQAKLVHGVGLPVGSSEPSEAGRRALYRDAVTGLRAAWASEHLSFNRARGPGGLFGTGFLLPPRQTIEGVVAAAERIRELARGLKVPFAFETGVNYLRPRGDEMADGAFVAAVATVADCGILLDLHNVWTNERNGRESVEDFLAQIPLERVIEIHLAGGVGLDGYWLDAHSGTVPEELIEIARDVVPALPNLGAIVYEVMPAHIPRLGLRAIRGQVEALHDLWALRRPAPGAFDTAATDSVVVRRYRSAATPSPSEWERTLGALVAGMPAAGSLAAELSADRGVALLRKLAAEARAGMIADALKLTTRLVLLAKGEEYHRALLAEFHGTCPAHEFASSEAFDFARWAQARDGIDVPYFHEVLAFEIAIARAATSGVASTVRFRHDPAVLLEALASGRMPEAPEVGEFELQVEPGSGGEDPGESDRSAGATHGGGQLLRPAAWRWRRLEPPGKRRSN